MVLRLFAIAVACYNGEMNEPLYLLDGYSVIYRSYFAFFRNPLRNPRGENSAAVFGFVRTLFSLFSQYKPEHFAVVMDSSVPTFRHEMYPEYKANRDATPDDLHAQIPVIEEILGALGVPTVRVDRYEADDVMATLAEACRKAGRACRVISGDKDLLQLVGPEVHVLRPGKNGIDELDREAVYRDWSVWPEQILDYLSLIGDAADNVPGVKGIGPKTAVTLLSRFGSLEGIYEDLSRVERKSQREKLAAGEEHAWLSRRLIQLALDAPEPYGIDGYRVGELNYRAAAPLLLAQGMRRQVVEVGLDPTEFGDVSEEAAPDRAKAPTDVKPGMAHGEIAACVLDEDERTRFAAEGSYELVTSLDQVRVRGLRAVARRAASRSIARRPRLM